MAKTGASTLTVDMGFRPAHGASLPYWAGPLARLGILGVGESVAQSGIDVQRRTRGARESRSTLQHRFFLPSWLGRLAGHHAFAISLVPAAR